MVRMPMLGRPGSARYHAAMPETWTHDNFDGHVVHLLPRLGAPTGAPETLRFPSRMGIAGRVLFALLNIIATGGAAWEIFALWTNETPGWWFNLLITAVTVGLVVVLWAILVGSIRQAKIERDLQAAWHRIGSTAVAEAGQVIDRRWVLAEDGAVASFDLLVRTAGGLTLCGCWRPANSRGCLLQSQVPGIGSETRIWRGPQTSADAPLVIEVADPTVG